MNAYNTYTPILTFYDSRHAFHAPQIEFLHGRMVPYFEVPRRIDVLRQYLLDASLINIQTPEQSLPFHVLTETHDERMIVYLRELSNNVESIIRDDFRIYQLEDVLDGNEYYYESNFPPKSPHNPDDRKFLGRSFFVRDNVSPIGKHTWQAVEASATLAYAGAQALLNGEKYAYAMCRPPGHHAGVDSMAGYCYVNNAAVAANTLRKQGKVAILDIDYHHGNGTQSIFYDILDVIFVSIHADPAVDYPYYTGYASETGTHNQIVNLPLPHYSDENHYLDALRSGLTRIQQFAPDFLIISLGFDTFKADPMAKFQLEVESYRKVARAIDALNLPTLFVQEGGYAVDQLGELAVSFFTGLSG